MIKYKSRGKKKKKLSNNLTLYLKVLGNENETKTNVSRRNEIINLKQK